MFNRTPLNGTLFNIAAGNCTLHGVATCRVQANYITQSARTSLTAEGTIVGQGMYCTIRLIKSSAKVAQGDISTIRKSFKGLISTVRTLPVIVTREGQGHRTGLTIMQPLLSSMMQSKRGYRLKASRLALVVSRTIQPDVFLTLTVTQRTLKMEVR